MSHKRRQDEEEEHPPAAKQPKMETILDKLEQIAEDSVGTSYNDQEFIRRAKTKLNGEDGHCFFLTDGTVKFLHEGDDTKNPPVFYLQDLQQPEWKGKVLMFYSASGSGKTVDLAGSSVSRGADLTIVVTLHDTEENSVEDKKKRNEASMEILKKKMQDVKENSGSLRSVLELVTEKNPLKLVVAIDEASSCPKLVRSIIAEHAKATFAVADSLGLLPKALNETSKKRLQKKLISVEYSVGGTGAASGSAGSNTKNFDVVPTSAKDLGHVIFDSLFEHPKLLLFPGQGTPQKVSFSLIEEKFPLLATLLKNGRMASIAASILRDFASSKGDLNEAELVSETIRLYMESNGMQPLVGDERRMQAAAAAAFAALLFQWSFEDDYHGRATPKDEGKFQETMIDMECGVEFSSYASRLISREPNPSVMKTIVAKFGLMEPSKEFATLQPGEVPEDLFEMKPAQQLVALTMLGLKPADFLQPTPTGFEWLSTHVAKCAIASLSVMKVSDDSWTRPSLQKVLGKIGLQVNEKATSRDLKKYWDSLDDYVVVDHTFGNSTNLACRTRAMDAPLDVVCFDEGDVRENLLQISAQTYQTLHEEMKPIEDDRRYHPVPPSAWINYGSSPLADGFITLFVRKKEKKGVSNPLKFTLMIQAKDYHNESRLDIKKLEEHAARCDEEALDGVFGKERLLCVAGREEVAKGQCTRMRNFIPYSLDKCAILKKLLKTLEKQRNVREIIKGSAIFCDKNGGQRFV